MSDLEKNNLLSEIESLKTKHEQNQALFRQNFAKRLKELRTRKNLTQQEVANQLGLRVSAYANWEQGTREPGSYYILVLSIIFDVDINEFFNNII